MLPADPSAEERSEHSATLEAGRYECTKSVGTEIWKLLFYQQSPSLPQGQVSLAHDML